MAEQFGIRSVITHATSNGRDADALRHWAEIQVWIDARFDWSKPEKLLKQLRQAAELAGKGE